MIFKKTTITIVMALLCLNFWAEAQEPVKPIKVGDKLPESFWQQEHSIYAKGNTTKHTLAAYKGKLLILDFWATWCGTCIKKIPLIDSLQSAEMAVLLVSTKKAKDSLATVSRFFAKGGPGHNNPQRTIVGDIYLADLFPFRQVPHFVWIDYQGRIIAITNYLFPSLLLTDQVLAAQRRSLSKSQSQ